MNSSIAEWLGTVFKIGNLPLAPGTWSSFIASLVWFFLFDGIDLIVLPIITIIIFFIGIISSQKIINDSNENTVSKEETKEKTKVNTDPNMEIFLIIVSELKILFVIKSDNAITAGEKTNIVKNPSNT